MDVSGEVADLMVKESLQAGETAVKLAASGIKNVAALLIALAQSDRKIIGKTSIKKLTKDPSPAMVLPLKAKDVEQFSKLAKEYGVLYVIARPKGKEGADVDIISNERYSAKLNALFQAMGYPLPEQQKEQDKESKEGDAKKPPPALNKGDPRPSAGMARNRRRGQLNPLCRKRRSNRQRASPLSGAVWPRCKRPPRAWRNLPPCGRRSAHAENHYIIL